MAHFWVIFPILGATFFSPKNLTLSRTTSYGFLAPLMIQFQENTQREGRKTEGWSDPIL